MSRKCREIDQNSTHPASVNAKLAFLCEELEDVKKIVKNTAEKMERVECYLEGKNGYKRWMQ